jgi:hypothetical protein
MIQIRICTQLNIKHLVFPGGMGSVGTEEIIRGRMSKLLGGARGTNG